MKDLEVSYDPEKNKFDHHQKGGAGERDNGILYSSFGLIWKKYGEEICGSKEVANKIESKIVIPVDANDNGINIFDVKGEIAPYLIQDVVFGFRPSWKEGEDYDSFFMEALPFAIKILKREILKTKHNIEAENFVIKSYEEAKDKRIIILDNFYPWFDVLNEYSEPLYVVFKKGDTWRVEAVRKEKFSFENRKSFPESWAGKRDKEMADASGVKDAIFCHNGRFLVVANSKEGAIALAEKALIS